MLKKFFIPHSENDFLPHFLHPKRTYFYGSFFVILKCIAIASILFLPNIVFVSDDVLQKQENKIIELTNNLRDSKRLNILNINQNLEFSSLARAADMQEKGYFSHYGPNGEDLDYFLDKAQYKYKVAGENLAVGFTDMNELFNVWVKSRTHFANLVDTDFEEIGVGIVNGLYSGQPVLFVAQHFAAQGMADDNEKVSFLNTDESLAQWEDTAGKTKINAKVVVEKQAESIKVITPGEGVIELEPAGPKNEYTGEIIIDKTIKRLFQAVVSPTAVIDYTDGTSEEVPIRWKEIYVAPLSGWTKYIQGIKLLPDSQLTAYNTAKTIYIIFFIIFFTALVLKIFIEIKKQHPHVIVKTIVLLLLLCTLIVV